MKAVHCSAQRMKSKDADAFAFPVLLRDIPRAPCAPYLQGKNTYYFSRVYVAPVPLTKKTISIGKQSFHRAGVMDSNSKPNKPHLFLRRGFTRGAGSIPIVLGHSAKSNYFFCYRNP